MPLNWAVVSRLVILVVSTYLLTSGGVFAQSDESTGSKPDKSSPDRLIVHVMAEESQRDSALGVSLLLNDILTKQSSVKLIDRSKVLDSAQKGGIFRGSEYIYLKDVPYLCLATDANKILLGWLESEGQKVSLTLRLYDGGTVSNIKSRVVTSTSYDARHLIDEAVKVLPEVLGIENLEAIKSSQQTFSLELLKKLGQVWRKLEKPGMVKKKVIVDLLFLRDMGIRLPNVFSSQITGQNTEISDSPLKALISDLEGKETKALQLYNDLGRVTKKNLSAKLRQGYLLLDTGNTSKAITIGKAIEAINPSNPKAYALIGFAESQSGQSTAAIEAYSQAIDNNSQDYRVYSNIARITELQRQLSQARKYYTEAVKFADALGRTDLASQYALHGLKNGGDDPLLDHINVKILSAENVETLNQLLEEKKDSTSRPVLFAKARLAIRQEKFEEATDLLMSIKGKEARDYDTNLYAAEFHLSDFEDIDKSIQYYSEALKRRRDDPRLWIGLAQINQKAGFCDKSISYYKTATDLAPESLKIAVGFADLLIECKQFDDAKKVLASVLNKYPDYAPPRLSYISMYRKLQDEAGLNAAMKELTRIDIELAKSLVAQPAKKTEGKNKPAKKPNRKLADVNVTYPVTKHLVKVVPDGVGRLALINKDVVEDSTLKKILQAITNPRKLDTVPFEKDLVALLSQSVEMVSPEGIEDSIRIYPGKYPFRPDSFSRVIKKHQLDGVALYELTPTDNGMKADLYCFTKNSNEVLHTEGELAFNFGQLQRTNTFIFVLPILLLVLISVFFFLRVKKGSGGLIVRIRYTQTFESGHFALRLSKRELAQAFNIEKLMRINWDQFEGSIEERIRKFFSSSSPYITMAIKKRASFRKILPGDYWLYITGVMVNIDSRRPIGSHEISKRVTIEKDKTKEIEVNLEVQDAYLELRVTQEVTVKRKEIEQTDEGPKEVERDVVQFEEVDGAIVEVNDDPSFTKRSIAGEPVTYTLPMGTYRITAKYKNLAAIRTVELVDTTPAIIELRLVSKTKEMQVQELTADDIREEIDPIAGVHTHGQTAIPNSNLRKTSPPEAIELADEILSGPMPIMSRETSSLPSDLASTSLDLDDLFKTASNESIDDLFSVVSGDLDETTRDQYLARARQMAGAGRHDEATELYLRGGDFDLAAESCQRSGNQALTYKVYGMSYLKSGQYREAAEMFKFADEPLLEAEALEGLRLVDEANLKRGMYWDQIGDIGKAMEAYMKAGAWSQMGALHERLQNYQQAGEAFFRARNYNDAGRMFLEAEDAKKAAESFEMDGQFDRATELYKQLGADAKVFHLMEKAGRFCEAAEGFKKIGMNDEAIHACQQVMPESSDYLKSSLIMGKIFIEKDENDLARNCYHKVVLNADISQENLERYYEFAVLIQEQGFVHEGFALFERLQTVKYNYADVSIRIQNLRERIEQERSQFGTAPPPGTVPPFPGYRTNAAGLSTGGSPPPASASATPVSSRYYFESELGRGAMGIVYKARDTALDRIVAYKTVSNAIKENPAALKYFLSEAKSLAALNHMNVVTVFDVGQESENYFITMEYVDGRSLAEFIREKGRLSTKNCIVIASKICTGLEYAHKKNVVHRDIKPSNIMISNDGEVKIMDFGLAKIMTEAVQDRTIVRGTPLYMSPEQVEGVGVDNQSDIYSFGVTFFEMATGTLPFTKGDIAYHHLHTPPPSPIRYNPSLPEAMEKIILKCLAKKKEDRYASAAEIKQDLAPLRVALMRG